MSPPVQELPTAYKSVRLYCLPLRGRHAQWSCPTNMERTLAVGRDDPGTPVQELPSAYNFSLHVIVNPVRTPGATISCRNC